MLAVRSTVASRSSILTFAILRKILSLSACASYFWIQKRVAQTHNKQHSIDTRILEKNDICRSVKLLFAITRSWRVGYVDGWAVGLLDGCFVGDSVGWLVGWSDGRADGWPLDFFVGRILGLSLGAPLGHEVGWSDGRIVGWLVDWLDDWFISKFPDMMIFWRVESGASSHESELVAVNSSGCNHRQPRKLCEVTGTTPWDTEKDRGVDEEEKCTIFMSAFRMSGCIVKRSRNSPPQSNPWAYANVTFFDLPTSSVEPANC